MALSVRKVQTAKPGRHMDGQGLMLLVKASGARSWVLRYQIKGRRRDMGLGAWPEISLAKARERAMDGETRHRPGAGSHDHRAREEELTFQEAAEALIGAKRDGWRNAKHAAQWTSTLARYVFPAIGLLEVQTITTENILAVLTPIWTEKPETASRVRQRVEAVLDYATAIRRGRRTLRDGADILTGSFRRRPRSDQSCITQQ